MLLELIIWGKWHTHARTDARTHDIASPWAPVGAKNNYIDIYYCTNIMRIYKQTMFLLSNGIFWALGILCNILLDI